MTLYKFTTYPHSFSLNEAEFRLALQGAYDTVILTYRGKDPYVPAKRTLNREHFMPGVQRAKLRMTKPHPMYPTKPYWVVVA